MEITFNKAFLRFAELWSGAKRGDPLAHYELAKLYARSKAKEGAKKAFEHCGIAAAYGWTDARFTFGRYHETGFGVKKNCRRAITWYKRAADSASEDVLSHPDISGISGNASLEFYLSNEDYAQQTDELMKKPEDEQLNTPEGLAAAAECGNAKAQYRYGLKCYKHNWQDAIFWYEKAAAQGYDLAMYALGEHYERGNDFETAAAWWRAYAEARLKWRDERLGW